MQCLKVFDRDKLHPLRYGVIFDFLLSGVLNRGQLIRGLGFCLGFCLSCCLTSGVVNGITCSALKTIAIAISVAGRGLGLTLGPDLFITGCGMACIGLLCRRNLLCNTRHFRSVSGFLVGLVCFVYARLRPFS